MNRVLVTGGAGFIGSHLCERLLKEGNEVICLDNYFTGSKKNVEHLLDDSNFISIEHDVTESISFDIDQIYNFASPASVSYIHYNPIQTMKICFIGALNMLELARRKKAKILQASTSEVYGDPSVHPQVEEYWGNVNPVGVRASYDEGKRIAETLFMDYHRLYGLDIRIARIFNTYGPRMMKDGRVVSNFVIQALNNDDITIYGDGLQTRSFCYIDDLVDGLIKMMNTNKTLEYPINLGNAEEYSIKELAELIIELTNSKSKIVYKSLPKDDPRRRKPDISKAENILSWHPKVKIKEGLVKTIKYFEDILLLKGRVSF